LFPFTNFILFTIKKILPNGHTQYADTSGDYRIGSSSYVTDGGTAFVASFITLVIASSFSDALVIAFSLSLGNFLPAIMLRSIYERSTIEKRPAILKGLPLFLISMGLLSLVFSSAASVLLK
jgi:Na+-translocating ferredoxin:NAD+ oxidoreductase RnfA subunit